MSTDAPRSLMKKIRLALLFLSLLWAVVGSPASLAAEPCQAFRGRIMFYPGDMQTRLWHIGTHHEFEPAASDNGTSWDRAMKLLHAQGELLHTAKMSALYADFIVCPTEPLRKGWVQPAIIRSMKHVHVVSLG